MHICLFDIDGTLLLSSGAGKAAMQQALAQEFSVREPIDDIPVNGRTDRAIVGDILRRQNIPDTTKNWERFLTAYLQHLPSCLLSRQGRVLPGVVSLLEQLRQRNNIVLGLQTGNVRDGAHLKLSHYDLMHHFVLGGYGDHHRDRVGVAHDALAEASRQLNGSVAPERVWIIGDTPLDIECARAIGARCVAVATGHYSLEELGAYSPDVLLEDFSRPQAVLALWRRS